MAYFNRLSVPFIIWWWVVVVSLNSPSLFPSLVVAADVGDTTNEGGSSSSSSSSFWSWFSSSNGKKSTSFGEENNIEDDIDLVSPIVNREIQVAVKAPWSSSPTNVMCEAWTYLRDYTFLDAMSKRILHEKKQQQQQEGQQGHDEYLYSYEKATEFCLSTVAMTTKEDEGDDEDGNGKRKGILVDPLLLKLTLTLRAQSPTCELHRGLALEANPFHNGNDFIVIHHYSTTTDENANDNNENDDDDDDSISSSQKVIKSLDDFVQSSFGSTTTSSSASSSSFASIVEKQQWLLPGETPYFSKTGTTSSNTNDEETSTTTTGTTGKLIILYTNIGTSSFAKWYQTLVNTNVPFVVRHLGGQYYQSHEEDDDHDDGTSLTVKEPDDFTLLQGYGVRLDIRNVEYKVFDDRGKSSSSDHDGKLAEKVNVSSLESILPQHFLAGINLTAVLADGGDIDDETLNATQQQNLQAMLWKVHDAQVKHGALIPPTWQRRQLSLQAATVIANLVNDKENGDDGPDEGDDDDVLLSLQHISQNLPSLASTLVHVNVPEEITELVEPMENALQSLIKQGFGGLWINGKPLGIERPSFNVFEMIRTLQNEQAMLDELQANMEPYFTNKPMEGLKLLQDAWMQGSGFFDSFDDDDDEFDDFMGGMGGGKSTSKSYLRVNVESGQRGAVIYMNDVEKDPMYQDWPQSVQRMIMAMQYGMPPVVRRNLFTVLLVGDVSPESTQIGRSLFMQLAQSQFPIRMGILLVDEKDIATCSRWVQKSKSEPKTPCPVPKGSWLDNDDDSVPSNDELMQIPFQARDMHRLVSYATQLFESRKELIMAYEQYLLPSIQQSPPANGQFTSLYDAFSAHGEILVGIQFVPHPPTPTDVAKQLLHSMDDDIHPYGKALRFAVDKGLKPGMGFLNGRPLPISGNNDDNDMTGEQLTTIFQQEQQVLMEMIMTNEITDTKPRLIYRHLLSSGDDKNSKKKKNIFPKVHPLLSNPTDDSYMQINHKFGYDAILSSTNGNDDNKNNDKNPTEADAVVIIDAFVDYDTTSGLDTAIQFVDAMESVISSSSSDTNDDDNKNDDGSSSSSLSTAIGYRILPSTVLAASDPLCTILSSVNRIKSLSSTSTTTTTAGIIKEILQWKKTKLLKSSNNNDDDEEDDDDEKEDETLSSLIDKTTLESLMEHGNDNNDNNENSPCSNTDYIMEGFPKKVIVSNGRVYKLSSSSSNDNDSDTDDDDDQEEQEELLLDGMDIELLMSLDIDNTKIITNLFKDYTDSKNIYDTIGRSMSFLLSTNQGSSTGGTGGSGSNAQRSSPEPIIRSMEEDLDLIDDNDSNTNNNKKNPFKFTWNDDTTISNKLRSKVTAIVDPVTETAQRLSTLLRVFRDELQLPLTLILAPKLVLDGDSKIPIASYYRFVADSSTYQDSTGLNFKSLPPMAHFSNLPPDHVLTVRMDVPELWDIQQTQIVQDTDNLRCDIKSGCSDAAAASGTVPIGVEMYKQRQLTNVEYGLSHLLFFGQCYDSRGSPPNGLQLTLSKKNHHPSILGTGIHNNNNNPSLTAGHSQEAQIGPDGTVSVVSTSGGGSRANDDDSTTNDNDVHSQQIYSDTLVMKTVGYWQLRANPGIWNVKIDEQSKGADIFDMMEGKLSRRGGLRIKRKRKDNTKRLIMGDFVSHSETLLVQRKRGMEKESLFADTTTTSPSTSSSGMTKKKGENDDDEEDDVINVFSLATGHLYERFLKIMMLSVTKRTSSKVKFWLFENFLSPTFKSSARAMAQKIGCDIEFVTYKWPEWLRGQSEKQRIIWGYKILFLDVLFPMNVKKIIYVDADQVVRGDLKELWDMDLQGAPYGYTPMCSSRESTLGYQFWNTGFWKTHLRGKPYHISALYVVDLQKFRQTLVGDQLRAIYQQLSADPNSLANLDQDLPNYAQHQVKIFSLPQEWLWCESWCSDETKSTSKTIDLCNNPLHKEPKVSMAKRIISGELFQESWIELDAEVESYEQEYFSSLP